MFDFMQFISFYLNEKKCKHPNALINSNEGYCPDCGVYLKKYFYIVRCSHCDIKREASLKGSNIIPNTKFCPNCGGSDFYIEKLDSISIVDINYAVHRKEVEENYNNLIDTTQVWVEKEMEPKKLKIKYS